VPNVQAGFALLKPGGWYYDAGWEPRHYETPPTEWAIEHGFEKAEQHTWQYWQVPSDEEYAALQIERERMAVLGCDADRLKPREQRDKESNRQVLTCENLPIAQKPVE
jgi:hypothetical protein